MEEKRPLTRTMIDAMIAEVEVELEGAVAKKDYAKCPPLQQKLDGLLKKRDEFPTIEELRKRLQDAEQAVH